MTSQKGSVFIMAIICLLLVIGCGAFAYFYFFSSSQKTVNHPTQLPANDPTKNHITFTKPASWIEKTEAESNNLIFKSPDLTITINRLGTNPNTALDQVLHPSGEQAQYNSDIKEIKVSGLKTVSYHNNYENHDQTFVIAQPPSTTWEIHISSKDQQTENSHRTEIDQFIESIQIK